MKKVFKCLLLFLLTLFISIVHPLADKENDEPTSLEERALTAFRCTYSIEGGLDNFKADLEIEVKNFDYKQRTGNATFKFNGESYTSSYTGNGDEFKYKIYLFRNDSGLKEYIKNFDGRCPRIFKNANPVDDEQGKGSTIEYYIDTAGDPNYMNIEVGSFKTEMKSALDSDFLLEADYRQKIRELKGMGIDDIDCGYFLGGDGVGVLRAVFYRKYDIVSDTYYYQVAFYGKSSFGNMQSEKIFDPTIDIVFDNVTIHKNTFNNIFRSDYCVDASLINFGIDKNNKTIHISYDKAPIEQTCESVQTATKEEQSKETPPPSKKKLKCEDIIGSTGQFIIKGLILIVQIAAAIFAVVQATLMILPAVAAHDAGALNASFKRVTTLAAVLLLILLLRPIIKILGSALGFDTSCIV